MPLQDTGEDRNGRLEAPVAALFSTIHPVFRVSLLKPAPPPSSRVYVNLPNPDIDLQVPTEMDKVLGFILEKISVPTEMDEFREISVQFRTQFGEISRFEAQNSFRA